MSTFTKPAFNPVSTRQEIHTLVSANGSGLTYTFCDRTDLTDKRSNYFVSFNLPHEQEALATGSTTSLQSPHLQQLNVDQMVIVDIDSQFYNELIDGRSVNFTVPQQANSGTTISAKTVVSTTYRNLQKFSRDQFLGTNIAYLFCDDINLPYTGTTSDGVINKATQTTWENTGGVTEQITATAFDELIFNSDVGTDSRPVSSVNYAVNVGGQNYPTNTNTGYNYDIPVGFVALDKGYLILTHPDIVDNIPFSQGLKRFSNLSLIHI